MAQISNDSAISPLQNLLYVCGMVVAYKYLFIVEQAYLKL